MKRIHLLALASALTLVLSSCANQTTPASTTTTTTERSSTTLKTPATTQTEQMHGAGAYGAPH